MESIGTGLTWLLVGGLGVIGAWVLAQGVLFLKSMQDDKKYSLISNSALDVVKSVAQELEHFANSEKKAAAIDKLDEVLSTFGIKLDRVVLDTWVENAVKRMKDELAVFDRG